MKKDLEGKCFGQLKVIKYVGNSKYYGMKIVKNGDNQSQKIGYPQIFIRWFRLQVRFPLMKY